MTYEHLGEGALEYFPCRYGNSKQLFRGPKNKLDRPYLAAVGGTETYGKFLESPYAALLQTMLQKPVVNLGCVNGGVDAVAGDADMLKICRGAEITIFELTGAQNITNRYYSVHPRRNDRFLKSSKLLAAIYPGMDFTEYHFTRHLLSALKKESETKFELVKLELQEAWVGRMQSVMDRIGGKILLLWVADHLPGQNQRDQLLGHDPMFIENWMIEALDQQVAGVVTIAATQEEIAAGFERMVFNAMEEPAANEMLGPVVHEAAARKLVREIKTLS